MTLLRRLTFDLGWLISIAATVVVVWSVVAGSGQLAHLPSGTLVVLGLFFIAIVAGEAARLRILTGRETAPMSSAAALGLALTVLPTESGAPAGAALVTATITVAMVVRSAISRVAGSTVSLRQTSAHVACAAVAPLLYRSIDFSGRSLVEWQTEWVSRRWLVGVVMVAVGAVAMLVELTVEALARAGEDQAPLLPAVIDELRSNLGLATALVTSGALIALAEFAIGVAALPLFLFPLVLTYFAVQRYAAIRVTYRQTIGALSSLTDRAGYTTLNHAQRVSSLAVAVGRDLGMGQRDLTDLEYAALLHDLGQVALREPIPEGATVMAAPADQQRIAHDGAEIVRTTGVLDTVAQILEAQTVPYRQVREFGQDLPMASRIIKVTNAYDDMAGALGENDDRAMERIHLGLGYEYDPRVVESLSRVLQRRRRAFASMS